MNVEVLVLAFISIISFEIAILAKLCEIKQVNNEIIGQLIDKEIKKKEDK